MAAWVCALTKPGSSAWPGTFVVRARCVAGACFRLRGDFEDAAFVDGHRRVLVRHSERLDGDHPARLDKRIDGAGRAQAACSPVETRNVPVSCAYPLKSLLRST